MSNKQNAYIVSYWKARDRQNAIKLTIHANDIYTAMNLGQEQSGILNVSAYSWSAYPIL